MLEGIARAQRSLNRPKSSIETLERALELVEGVDGKEGEARARLLAGLARGRMLDGRFADSAETARRALEATIAAGMRWAEGHARNTLGFSLAMIGEVDEGAEQLREAIRIARERDDLPDLGDAYVNYSDMLHILGRSDEARAITLEGREASRRPPADRDHVARLPARRVRLRRRRLGGVGAAPARPASAGRACTRA